MNTTHRGVARNYQMRFAMTIILYYICLRDSCLTWHCWQKNFWSVPNLSGLVKRSKHPIRIDIYPTVLTWIHAICLAIARVIGLCRCHLCRSPLVRFQVQWDVYTRVIRCRCETTSHAHHIRSQDTRKYSMSNTTVSIACTTKEMGLRRGY